MKLSGNTILITGGGSGIGLALALEFKRLGNDVIVAGRDQTKLETAKASGLKTLTVDMSNADSIKTFAAEAIRANPRLNVVIHNAGVMMNEKVTRPESLAIAEQTIETNLLGPIRLTNALLPHFLKQDASAVITVTSGLAFVPLALTPTYSATKAAVHSFTEALRFQLRGTSVEVKELVPPYVRTSLMGDRQASDANAMPLEDFIAEVFTILRETPDAPEILVQKVTPQRTAAHSGVQNYSAFFERQNEMLMNARKKEWDAL